MKEGQWKYRKLVQVAVVCHVIENLALVVLTVISSTDNAGNVLIYD